MKFLDALGSDLVQEERGGVLSSGPFPSSPRSLKHVRPVFARLIPVALATPRGVKALTFDSATTVAQCVNNRTPAGVPIQSLAAVISNQLAANATLWTLGKALYYRIVSTLDGLQLTLPAIDAATAEDITKAPPGLRFVIENASVVNGLVLKRATGLVVANLPAGVTATLTATATGWELQYGLERETFEALNDANGQQNIYIGLYGGETVQATCVTNNRPVYLPRAYEGWRVYLNNSTLNINNMALYADGASTSFLTLPFNRTVQLVAAPGNSWIAKFLTNS